MAGRAIEGDIFPVAVLYREIKACCILLPFVSGSGEEKAEELETLQPGYLALGIQQLEHCLHPTL
jgi:hypothetical protein